jgi:uncharacterized SAM-binding protein YcdF (DUF218 family)
MFVAALLVFILLLGFAAPRLGAWLVREDPLVKSDAIVVLGGTMYERQLEAVDLFKAGYAPRIYLIRELQDWGEAELIRRGIDYPRAVDMQAAMMEKIGVPKEAIGIIEPANSTAEEAQHLRDLVTREHYARLIIVTSKQHTRRARLVMNRTVVPAGAQIIVHASKYDLSDVDHWWRDRSTLRFTLFESQRLFAYWIGLAD